MNRYQPSFSITSMALNPVIEIGELLGYWSAKRGQTSPLLRGENRIRIIQASSAIEHNSLSTEQVTALLEGKWVLAPAEDIQGVRSATRAYELVSGWHAANIRDLPTTHRTLMTGLASRPGALCDDNVGIYRGTRVAHMALSAAQVLRLIADLLSWLEHTELHLLIASSVFHYEFEFIHPFADGNGWMRHLWQTSILSHWRQKLVWLSVETLVHHQQERYYDISGICNKTSDCTLSVTWMLQSTLTALKEGLKTSFVVLEEMSGKMSEEVSVKVAPPGNAILRPLAGNPELTVRALAEISGISARTVERRLQGLQAKGGLIRIGTKKGGSWLVKQN